MYSAANAEFILRKVMDAQFNQLFAGFIRRTIQLFAGVCCVPPHPTLS